MIKAMKRAVLIARLRAIRPIVEKKWERMMELSGPAPKGIEALIKQGAEAGLSEDEISQQVLAAMEKKPEADKPVDPQIDPALQLRIQETAARMDRAGQAMDRAKNTDGYHAACLEFYQANNSYLDLALKAIPGAKA